MMRDLELESERDQEELHQLRGLSDKVARIREAVVELEGEYVYKVRYESLVSRDKVLDIIEEALR